MRQESRVKKRLDLLDVRKVQAFMGLWIYEEALNLWVLFFHSSIVFLCSSADR